MDSFESVSLLRLQFTRSPSPRFLTDAIKCARRLGPSLTLSPLPSVVVILRHFCARNALRNSRLGKGKRKDVNIQ